MAVSALQDGVYHVEMNRPASRNSLNSLFWPECRNVFEYLASESDCRVVILSARGKSFCAGLDLTDPLNQPPSAQDAARRGLKFIDHVKIMQDGISAVELCLKPVIAVVHGACVGAGVDLITAVDIRICADDAYSGGRRDSGSPAEDRGNDSAVRELCLTARNFDSKEAHRLGLVSAVLPSLEEAMVQAKHIAGLIAANSPVAVVGTKKNLNYARDHTVHDSLDYVRTWNASMIQTDDIGEGFSASMKKTKPVFSKL
eukprot:CAMPEP_0115161240 /NCGR_PEP_ID=MMETSP0227-20121206/71237_1 /TAXON_ID=89957 /ORGANISM="Polarella glacialis, Strain CCMP 1383" /LENGTH=256 /DNA_ID=CAMNT_0002573199 /DNA_START=30 /DNA_END=801 /DNA_ORIENTATION=+